MKYNRYIILRLPPLLLDRGLSRYRLSEIQTYMNLYSCALIAYNPHTLINVLTYCSTVTPSHRSYRTRPPS